MTITNERWRYDMRVAIITANTDIYKGTKANESGEAVKLVAEEAGLEVVFMRALPLIILDALLDTWESEHAMLLTELKEPTVEAVENYFAAFAERAPKFYFGENDRGWRASA